MTAVLPGDTAVKTRVVFCTYPSLYSSAALRPLLAAPNIDVVGVVCSTRMLKKRYGVLRNALIMSRQSGVRYLAYHLWITDIFHLLQPFAARKSVRRLCEESDIPVHYTADINASNSIAFLRGISPDVVISAYFNQRIGTEARELPRYGSINIHPSALPDYRGTDPVFHAMLEGDAALGVSVHYMDDAFDTGNLLRQDVMESDAQRTALAYYDALFERGARLAVDVVDRIREGWSGSSQPPGGRYLGWPTRLHVAEFRRRGRQFLTFSDYVAAISK